jgi:hypothetical protein
MRIPFCLIIFFFICPTVNAQQITKAEAIAFAEKLHQKKILNEAGKHRMIQAIDGSNIHLSIEEYGKGITKQSILGFCASAFQIEMLYRIGYREQSEKKIQQQRKKNTRRQHKSLKIIRKHTRSGLSNNQTNKQNILRHHASKKKFPKKIVNSTIPGFLLSSESKPE